MNLLAVAAIVALVAASISCFAAARVLRMYFDRSGTGSEGLGISNLELVTAGRLDELTGRIDALTLAVAEGIKGYKRAENRVQKTVTSARRLVRESGLEHAGIEAEYDELQSRDDEPVHVSEVLPLLPEMESDPPTHIPWPNADQRFQILGVRDV